MGTHEKLLAIANYMAMEYPPAVEPNFEPVDGIFVFCREDPRMAEAAARLYARHRARWILLSGGIGKGSGERSRRFGSEAAHQKDLLVTLHNVPEEVTVTECHARNGAENSRFGIGKILEKRLPHRRIILLNHPRNARRVYAAHTNIARGMGFDAEYRVACSNDPFDPDNPVHRAEILEELLRVADWPTKGWSDAQPDLPLDLVGWAREQLGA